MKIPSTKGLKDLYENRTRIRYSLPAIPRIFLFPWDDASYGVCRYCKHPIYQCIIHDPSNPDDLYSELEDSYFFIFVEECILHECTCKCLVDTDLTTYMKFIESQDFSDSGYYTL